MIVVTRQISVRSYLGPFERTKSQRDPCGVKLRNSVRQRAAVSDRYDRTVAFYPFSGKGFVKLYYTLLLVNRSILLEMATLTRRINMVNFRYITVDCCYILLLHVTSVSPMPAILGEFS